MTFTAAEQNTISKYTVEGCIAAYESALRFAAQRKGGFDGNRINLSFVALLGRKLKEG